MLTSEQIQIRLLALISLMDDNLVYTIAHYRDGSAYKLIKDNMIQWKENIPMWVARGDDGNIHAVMQHANKVWEQIKGSTK